MQAYLIHAKYHPWKMLLPRRTLIAAAVAVSSGSSWAQVWQDQVNISMCTWTALRANVIRDRVYLDGGALWWLQGFSDGTVNPVEDATLHANMYYIDLSRTIDTAVNETAFFATMSKTTDGTLNNLAPNYIDGVMFANNYEFILYGGLLSMATNESTSPGNEILVYERYQYGVFRSSFVPGFVMESLNNNVSSTYVTNGAGVSAPSENMGFYFSGMRASDWGGPIYYEDGSANTTANTLISVNMSIMRNEQWQNESLPDGILGRANAELVWVPVSASGVLVAIGGVINPVDLSPVASLTAEQLKASEQISPSFMKTVSIYDIATQTWFLQNTTGDIPPQLTLFCSVLASASDGSSHNIYIYGGFNGLNATDIPSDDVYVLSVPSFNWIKVYSGTSTHGRKGHKCIKPYPDKMLVFGGEHVGPENCVEGGIIQVFNLNGLRFQNTYDPEMWSEYQVPDLVTARIGGTSRGGATVTGPNSWNSTTLSQIFQTKYTKPIQTWYPYVVSNGTTSGPSHTAIAKPHSGFPSWAGAVLGVLLGLLILSGCIIFWLIWRRRQSEGTTEPNLAKPKNWMSGAVNRVHSGSGKSASLSVSNEMEGSVALGRTASSDESQVDHSLTHATSSGHSELNSSPIYEMQDAGIMRLALNQHPVELPTHFNTVTFPSPVTPESANSIFNNNSRFSFGPSPSPPSDSPISPVTSVEAVKTAPPSKLCHHRQISELSVLSSSIDGIIQRTAPAEMEGKKPHRPQYGSDVSDGTLGSFGTRSS